MALKRINPTKTKAWEKLLEHFNEIKDVHMKDSFAQNSNRANDLSIEWEDFYVDYSKHRISNRTIDLIRHLEKEKKYEIYFIMGADNLINFHKWHKWKSIIKKCNILVFDRQGYKTKSLKSVTFNQTNNKNLTFINFNKVNISSSQLRKV